MCDETEQRVVRSSGMTPIPEQSSDSLDQTNRDSTGFWPAAIVDSSEDALIGKDLHGLVTFWNKGAELIFGYAAEEIMGRPITLIIPPDRIDEESAIRTSILRGEKILHFETKRLRKDGAVIPISFTVSPIRDNQGRLIGASKIARDCSERDLHERLLCSARDAAEQAKVVESQTELLASALALASSRAEAEMGHTALLASALALASSRAETEEGRTALLAGALALASSRAETEKGHTALMAGVLALASSRAETKLGQTDLLASAAALASSQAETKLGQTDLLASEMALASSRAETKLGQTDLLASEVALASSREETKVGQTDLLASALVIKTASLANALLIRGEFALRASEERYRLQAEILRTSNEQVLIARDRADKASRAKSHFLAGMSHELRTPLNGILGYAQLLHMEGGLNPTQNSRVDAMLAAGRHLLEMITCVLDLSEIEAEHVELQAVKFDVQLMAEACLDLIRPMAEAKGLALRIAATPNTRLELIADQKRLRQVLLNLLGNAVKFTSQGVIELRLRSAAGGTMFRIEVVDTGAGVPAGLSKRLFKDFARLDTEATRSNEGAGLGLALSARLVALMGGRLGHDANPGGGSVFWLELPLNIVAASTPTSAPASDGRGAQPSPLSMRSLRVLIVDDVLMNRDIASSFLRTAGHQTMCIEDGAAAVAAVASTDFDVVLMDVRMPQMDGLEATRRIRALGGTRGQVPIVALTAQVFTDQVAECRKAGMGSHLAKPFDMNTLLAAVVSAVEAQKMIDGGTGTPGAADRLPADAAISPVDEQLPVLNPIMFERTAAFLTPESVASHLRTIAELGERVLRELRAPDALKSSSEELAVAAHTLAGSAGMFGCERLTAICRQFERALKSGGSKTPALADGLCVTLQVTLPAIYSCLSIAVEDSLVAVARHSSENDTALDLMRVSLT